MGAAARSGKSREAALLLGVGCCVPGDTPGSMLTYRPTSCLPPWLPQDLVEKFFNNDNAASFRKSWHRLSALPDAYNYKVGGEGVLLARAPCLSHPVPALQHRIRSSERGVSSCSCCPHRPAGLLGRARGRLDGHVPTSGAALRCAAWGALLWQPGGNVASCIMRGPPAQPVRHLEHHCCRLLLTRRRSASPAMQAGDVAIVHTHGPKPDMSL